MKYNRKSNLEKKYHGDVTGYLKRDLGIVEANNAYRILWYHFLEISGLYANAFDSYDKFFEWFCGLEDSEIRSILALETLGK